MISIGIAAWILSTAACEAAASSVEIETSRGSPTEIATRDQLRRLLDRHDVDRWIFHRRVLIKDRTIPHSHPMVTMRTGESDRELIANFLHENIHWYLSGHEAVLEPVISALRERYPALPVEVPEGAGDAYSSYLHLIVCTLELAALREVLGDAEAVEAMRFWTTHHYTAIYATVLADEAALMSLLGENGLTNASSECG